MSVTPVYPQHARAILKPVSTVRFPTQAPIERPARLSLTAISLLTVFVLVVHGYHPFSEDGGLYLAGVRKLLDPTLYPHDSAFVTGHLRFSLFAPLVAGVVRTTHLSVEATVFLLYLAGVWCTLAAAWMLTARVADSFAARLGGVALLSCWMVLPVAGTSLMLTDPYLTARSWTTPLTLLALAWTLDALAGETAAKRQRSYVLVAGAIAVAACLHPLMAGYALAAVLTLASSSYAPSCRRRWLRWSLLLAAALVGAALLQWTAPAEPAGYDRIAMTRYYWFPFRWQWYEQLGLVMPLLVLAWLGRTRLRNGSAGRKVLAESGVLLALIALAVALLFCRAQLASHLVARLQPLRAFQIVYLIMILLLGAWLGGAVLKHHRWRWAALLVTLGGLMSVVAHATYPASAHLEVPFGTEAVAPRNGWKGAFLWCAQHTAKDSLFALDAHYITRDGEDAQLFRALAQRSELPDYSKDGGEASIEPGLTAAWLIGQSAQTGLEHASDPERLARLKPLGVTWIVLEAGSLTALTCPYRNESVKVCRVSP